MNVLYILLHCLISTRVGSKIFNCSNSPIRTTINCGFGSVIQVHKANQIFKPSCTGDIHSKCVRKRTDIYEECQGKSTCEVSENLHVVSGASLNGCPNRLNTVDIQYSCYNLSSPSTALIPFHSEVAAENLHIFSPGFPDRTPDSASIFSCVVKPPRSPKTTQITLNVVLLDFVESDEYCLESLIFEEFGYKKFCGDYYGWNSKTNHIIHDTLNFKYQKGFSGKGHQDTERVNLNLTCTDLSFIPGYSTSSEEVTASIPAAGAVTDRKSNVLESGTLYGIVSASITVVIIVVVIVIFFLVHRKRKKTSDEKQDSMEYERSSHMYSNVSDTNRILATLSKEVTTVDNIYQEDFTGIPATVGESKCKEMRSSNTIERLGEVPSREETINNVGEDVGKAAATNDNRSEESGNYNQDSEETIMCENNELYGRM